MSIRYLAASCLFLLALTTVARGQTSAFNYQGRLMDGGGPANGNYLLQFRLFDAAAGGNQIGETLTDVAVTAAQGVFTTQLDFGASAFSGEDRFLEIAVRKNVNESYTILNPRQQIASSPYSIRTLSAAQADVALDAQRLGGLEPSEYVNASTVNSTFIRNATTPQTANFNISGNGFFGGNVGIGTSAPQSKLSVQGNGYGLTHTNGAVTVGTFLTTGSGWIGTRSNHPLNFFTNDGAAAMQIVPTGEVGIGVAPQAGQRLDVGGNGRFQTANGNINLGSPNGETGMTFTNDNRADIRFDPAGLKLLAGSGTGIPANTSGILINTSGNVGIGTSAPTAKLQVENVTGSPGAALRVINNTFGGAAIVATNNSPFGTALTANGALFASGNIRQNLASNGVVKAMAFVQYGGSQIPTIIRCYDSVNTSTASDCGFIYGPVNLGLGQTGTRITFNFTVSDRFILTTPGFGGQASVYSFPNAQTVDILNNYGDFYIFIF